MKNKGELSRKQRSHVKMGKILKYCVNFKEDILFVFQMNILPFLESTLLAYDKSHLISFLCFHISRYLHEGQVYGISISCIEHILSVNDFQKCLTI